MLAEQWGCINEAQTMNIPVLPSQNTPLVSDDGKSIHREWHMFFTQWVTEMQKQASNEGIVFPGITNIQRAVLTAKQPIHSQLFITQQINITC